MVTNDLRKGDRVLLANGWYAVILDNKRGNIRLAKVEGLYTEVGSIYGHDIKCLVTSGGTVPMEYTKAQDKARAMNKELFG